MFFLKKPELLTLYGKKNFSKKLIAKILFPGRNQIQTKINLGQINLV